MFTPQALSLLLPPHTTQNTSRPPPPLAPFVCCVIPSFPDISGFSLKQKHTSVQSLFPHLRDVSVSVWKEMIQQFQNKSQFKQSESPLLKFVIPRFMFYVSNL